MKYYVEMIDEDGHHFVHAGDLNPGSDQNRRECYMCGSRRHWTKDCPRDAKPPKPTVSEQ